MCVGNPNNSCSLSPSLSLSLITSSFSFHLNLFNDFLLWLISVSVIVFLSSNIKFKWTNSPHDHRRLFTVTLAVNSLLISLTLLFWIFYEMCLRDSSCSDHPLPQARGSNFYIVLCFPLFTVTCEQCDVHTQGMYLLAGYCAVKWTLAHTKKSPYYHQLSIVNKRGVDEIVYCCNSWH